MFGLIRTFPPLGWLVVAFAALVLARSGFTAPHATPSVYITLVNLALHYFDWCVRSHVCVRVCVCARAPAQFVRCCTHHTPWHFTRVVPFVVEKWLIECVCVCARVDLCHSLRVCGCVSLSLVFMSVCVYMLSSCATVCVALCVCVSLSCVTVCVSRSPFKFAAICVANLSTISLSLVLIRRSAHTVCVCVASSLPLPPYARVCMCSFPLHRMPHTLTRVSNSHSRTKTCHMFA